METSALTTTVDVLQCKVDGDWILLVQLDSPRAGLLCSKGKLQVASQILEYRLTSKGPERALRNQVERLVRIAR